jgi:hypothetical protein
VLTAVNEATEEAKAGLVRGGTSQHQPGHYRIPPHTTRVSHTTNQREPNFQNRGGLKLFNRHGFLLLYRVVSTIWGPREGTRCDKRLTELPRQ